MKAIAKIYIVSANGMLAEGHEGDYSPPPSLPVKYEGSQYGNLKHMGAKGALLQLVVKYNQDKNCKSKYYESSSTSPSIQNHWLNFLISKQE